MSSDGDARRVERRPAHREGEDRAAASVSPGRRAGAGPHLPGEYPRVLFLDLTKAQQFAVVERKVRVTGFLDLGAKRIVSVGEAFRELLHRTRAGATWPGHLSSFGLYCPQSQERRTGGEPLDGEVRLQRVTVRTSTESPQGCCVPSSMPRPSRSPRSPAA